MSLDDETEKKSSEQVQSCTLGPVPDQVVHGTIGLQPTKPDSLKILSLSKAPEKRKAASVLVILRLKSNPFRLTWVLMLANM